jgi:hypothetical protein
MTIQAIQLTIYSSLFVILYSFLPVMPAHEVKGRQGGREAGRQAGMQGRQASESLRQARGSRPQISGAIVRRSHGGDPCDWQSGIVLLLDKVCTLNLAFPCHQQIINRLLRTVQCSVQYYTSFTLLLLLSLSLSLSLSSWSPSIKANVTPS